MLTVIHIIGILLTVGLLVAVSIASGRKVNDAKSFTTGGNAGSLMVCGAMLGTLAGGQSTIGTAQLAFSFGLSAWWFTIGAALGAVVLGVVYAGPLRRSGCTTVLEVVGRQYGRKTETIGSLLFLIGIFISIVAQVLTSSAMIGSLFNLPTLWSAAIGAALILLLVFFGGIKSAGAGGIVKLVLLYSCSVAAGIIVWKVAGGIVGMRHSIDSLYSLPPLAAENGLTDIESIHHRYGSLVARGPLKDLGGCLSLTLGVVSTQSYAQCIWSASTTAKARQGSLLCATFIPIIGAACTLVGIYMRGHYVTAAEYQSLIAAGEQLPAGIGIIENSAQTFPSFILNHLPAWFGGILLGTLLINILGCGSGLSLGAATILVRDVYRNLPLRLGQTKNELLQTRLSIVALLTIAVIVAHLFDGSFINDLGFLSLGLRAVAILLPLTFALWRPRRFSPRLVLAAMPLGVAAMLSAKALALPADPVYYGLLISATVIIIPSGRKNAS